MCKPAAMAALIGVAVVLHPTHADRRAWFVAALALSLLGDVFLMLEADLFVAGLGSFLLAHVAYTVGLRLHGGSLGTWLAGAAAVAAVDVVLARPVFATVRRRHRQLLGPVAAYVVVISVMVASALANAALLAVLGAALFFASDTLIAWERFVRSRPWAPMAIIVTYHLGQAGLVLSLAR
ncbi:MAG TPA: lysoplasmalogenase [Acidimicrobiia bacterium]|nr:lysoplasmalogenase [Acidimicrobiia bacterium]